MGYIQGEGCQQNSLFPPTLEEMVPEGHLARLIEAYGLALICKSWFSKVALLKTGRPCDDPADLLKLYPYGYFQHIRSSRGLATECQRNVEMMWLFGRLAPDFKTIASFRKDNSAAFRRRAARSCGSAVRWVSQRARMALGFDWRCLLTVLRE